MTRRVFTCDEVSIRHEQLLSLCSAGDLKLGINDDVSTQILNTPGAGPSVTTANAAGHLWNWIAFGTLIYSVYLSFSWHWWAFIPGIIVMRSIYGANKLSNSQNYLDAAMVDEDFYNRICSAGVWLYEMEPELAAKYADRSDRAASKEASDVLDVAL